MTDENTVDLWNTNQNEITNLCYYLDEENPIVELSTYNMSQTVLNQVWEYKRKHRNDNYTLGWNPDKPFEIIVWSSSFCYHKRVEENECTDIVPLDNESLLTVFDDIRKQARAKAEEELIDAEEKRRKAEHEKKIDDHLVTRIRQSQMRKQMRDIRK